jgi:succinate-acetate transporter protein
MVSRPETRTEIRLPEAGEPTRHTVPVEAATAGASIADPAPLGLAGFALTLFVLSVFNAGIVGASLSAVVLPVALFYGGIMLVLAGMWEFRRANTFGTLVFASYGSFWLSYAAFAQFVAPGLPVATAYRAVGTYLLAWTIFTFMLTIVAIRTNGAFLAVFVTLLATFVLLTVGTLSTTNSIIKAAGWAGLVTAAIAWYTSFALVCNSTWGKDIFPLFPLTR